SKSYQILRLSLLSWPSVRLPGLLPIPAWVIYLIASVLAFGESVGFIGLVLPGETGWLLGGALAATGRVNIPLMLSLAVIAVVAGGSTRYATGGALWAGAGVGYVADISW